MTQATFPPHAYADWRWLAASRLGYMPVAGTSIADLCPQVRERQIA